ncbi:hypothetical protein BDV23DRAFT_183601 [Aspergillus alliaceus]|uniref:Uncharacterized protein n=1 Tax=Petromyces alliaceus TaxID=209559 RepID=A0A5N7C8Z5_PETAA|nr:hypothetical protein BDV23DRAFT_183601 [Aspergillus alliaceus]
MLAIEHAAVLTNIICGLVARDNNHLPTDVIERVLSRYDNKTPPPPHLGQDQDHRALVRMQTLQSAMDRLVVRYISSYVGDLHADQFCDDAIGGEKIDYLPLPARSLTISMPFNPSRGIGQHECLWLRARRAMPLLVMSVAAFVAMFTVAPFNDTHAILVSCRYGEVVLQDQFYYVRFLGDFSRSGVLRFIPLSLFADYGVWYGIMLIESARQAHRLNILRLALLWGMLNMWGIAIVVPVYYFVYYLLTPLSTFDAADMRLTDRASTRTVLPTQLATHYATFLMAYLGPTLAQCQAAGFLLRSRSTVQHQTKLAHMKTFWQVNVLGKLNCIQSVTKVMKAQDPCTLNHRGRIRDIGRESF